MDETLDQILKNMEKTLHSLEKRVPPPKQVPFGKGFVFRYVEKTIHQALILKLARTISGLYAARLLLASGFLQEQAALQRMLDEFEEDIFFLASAVIFNNFTELHRKYLTAFYEEEFDNPESAIESTQKRPMIQRKKIRAHIARIENSIGLDPERSTEISRTMSKTYSGFVHGASPHIMDMYGGNPPHFQVRGMIGTIRSEEHRQDLYNYFYRGIIAFAWVAKAFGEEKLFDIIRIYADNFEKQSEAAGVTLR